MFLIYKPPVRGLSYFVPWTEAHQGTAENGNDMEKKIIKKKKNME